MRISERKISLILIIVLILGGFGWLLHRSRTLNKKEVYEAQFPPEYSGQQTTDLSDKAIHPMLDFNNKGFEKIPGKTNYSEKKLFVEEDFSSHLPIVLIDTNGTRPQISQMINLDLNCDVPIPGVEPYVNGTIKIIDMNEDNAVNSLKSKSDNVHNMKIKVRGNSSMRYDKRQYQFKLLDSRGSYKSEDILGIGKDSEWILNVSLVDKSLLRNYLALSKAGEFMPYTPDAKYCEVIWKDGDKYSYEGVYLMMESVKVGKNRVDIPTYHENSTISSMLVRRDRYNADGLMLDNYSRLNDLSYSYFELQYPKPEHLSPNGIKKMNKKINDFEEVLYSDDNDIFFKYRNYIDMDSFVDYFIINEFFMNYDAGYNSTYFYSDESGKIHMGPVWDFDQCLDNDYMFLADLETTAFHAAPWFDRMLRDPVFVYRIEQRYHELRKTILSHKSIENLANAVVKHLGPAIDRDEARWGYYYKSDLYIKHYDNEYVGRHTYTNYQEVKRILKLLDIHGKWLDEHIDSLYQFSVITLDEAVAELHKHKDSNIDYSNILAATFVVIFLVSVTLVLRHESE